MKKSIIFLALGALALSSCTQDDQPRVTTGASEGITFRARIPVASRATDITRENLDRFNVFAIDNNKNQYFFDEFYLDPDDDNYYISSQPYYWPTDNSKLLFLAYSTNGHKLNEEPKASFDYGLTITNFKVEEDINDQYDFVVASATGYKQDHKVDGVGLNFKHALAKISIVAKTQDENYTYEIAGVKLGSMPHLLSYSYSVIQEGSFDKPDDWNHNWNLLGYDEENGIIPTSAYFSDFIWNYDSSITLSTSDKDEDGSIVSNPEMYKNCFMVAPYNYAAWDYENDGRNEGNGAYIGVLMKITNKNSGKVIWPYPVKEGEENELEAITVTVGEDSYAWVAFPLVINLEPNNHYLFSIDFTNGAGWVAPCTSDLAGTPVFGDPIKFSAIVNDWDDWNENPGNKWEEDANTNNRFDDPFGIRRR